MKDKLSIGLGILLLIAAVFILGRASVAPKGVVVGEDPNIPPIEKQLIPVTERWRHIYDTNDLDVIQTYNLALHKAYIENLLKRVAVLEDPNAVPR